MAINPDANVFGIRLITSTSVVSALNATMITPILTMLYLTNVNFERLRNQGLVVGTGVEPIGYRGCVVGGRGLMSEVVVRATEITLVS